MRVRRLVDFPSVLVRLRCDTCKRAGANRLARLAVKYGAEILLDDLIVRLSVDCPWRDDPRGSNLWGILPPLALLSALALSFVRRFGEPIHRFSEVPLAYLRSSLDAFFTRPLPPGARPIAPGDGVAVSPCDGVLSETGTTEIGRLLQC